MAQSLSEGSVFNYTTTGAVANGDLMVLENMVGVALESATGSGKVIALALEGVFNVLAHTTGNLTRGESAFYGRVATGTKQSKVRVKTAATGYTVTTGSAKIIYARTIGTIWETKAGATSGRTSIKVKLIGGPMAYA